MDRSGLKVIFHLYVQCGVFFRLLSILLYEILGSYTVETNDVSSANSLVEDCKLYGRSFMHIRKTDVPKIEPCGTPASTDDQLAHWLLKTTRWNLLLTLKSQK